MNENKCTKEKQSIIQRPDVYRERQLAAPVVYRQTLLCCGIREFPNEKKKVEKYLNFSEEMKKR